jgi:YfiH family protein
MLQARSSRDLRYHVSPLLEGRGVPHAFSTRTGGVSPKPFDSLNLGIAGGADVQDAQANIDENYRRLRAAIDCSTLGRCWITQVHGPDVCTVRPGEAFENGTKGDALVSDDPTRVLSVKYADCVPILLATEDGRAVAAVHAGWRGLVAGVIRAAVASLADLSRQAPGTFVAAIGPCIGFDAFEVGPEVIAAFAERFGPVAPIRRDAPEGKGHVDLRQSALLELHAARVSPARIDRADLCTFGHPEQFFSHRRDGAATGRMAAVIACRGDRR